MVERVPLKLWLVMHDAYEDLLCFAQDASTAALLWHHYYELKFEAHRTVKCVQLPGDHPGVDVARAVDWDDMRFSEVIGTQLRNFSVH